MALSNQSVAERVEALIGSMSLAEKVGQLNMPIPMPAMPGLESAMPVRPPSGLDECERFVEGSINPSIGPGGGFFLFAAFEVPEGPRQQALIHNRLQEKAQGTRLGIPLLQINEGTHGVIAVGATIFPEGLALGSTWDPDLIERLYAAVAQEARAVGIHALSTLVIEPNRDPRLGRNCEGYTEDSVLLSAFAAAIVRGCQGENVADGTHAITVFTCFPTQSEPVSGMERGSIELSERTLREVFLPPWVAAVESGALGVMATYPSIDGTPSHATKWLLTNVLREELSFEGIVLSEGLGFETLIHEGIVETQKEAGRLAIDAGVDVNITYEDAYLKPLIDCVEAGEVSMESIDRAVRRVLEVKARLGLFDNPYVDPDRAVKVVHSAAHQELALEAARDGIVLLRNENATLPLSPDMKTIAVIGPNADAPRNQLGDYTVGMLAPELQAGVQPITTVLQGIKMKAPALCEVLYAKGCDVLGGDKSGFEEAMSIAAVSDVVIVVLGEQQGPFTEEDPGLRSTVGEGADVASLDLTGVQEELLRAIKETGTPTVLVLINGRPLSVPWAADHVPAILEAWLPGERGGEAIAEVLFGEINPSGRLPISIPCHSGQLPVYYNHRRSKAYQISQGYSYVDMTASPLYDFGYGLSFTRFEYRKLEVEPSQVRQGEEVRVRFEVRNVGDQAGTEVAQLYLRDLVASIAPRDKQLRSFKKVDLRPGEAESLQFTVAPRDMQLLDAHMRWVVEPGEFEVQVGASCTDIRLSGTFAVTA